LASAAARPKLVALYREYFDISTRRSGRSIRRRRRVASSAIADRARYYRRVLDMPDHRRRSTRSGIYVEAR
jgi:hypothetical protein